LIQEPHYYDFFERTLITGVGSNFESIISTNANRAEQEGRIRSCIWVNKKNDLRQIPRNCNDVTIRVLRIGGQSIPVASVYVPCTGKGIRGDETERSDRLQELRAVIISDREKDLELELCIAGDFSRHDGLGRKRGGHGKKTRRRHCYSS
jgi:exonuclease III